MIESQVDQLVFKALVNENLPAVGQHFEEIGLHIPCVSSRWFICLYVGCMPCATVDLVWNGFIQHGTMFLIQVAIALLALRSEDILVQNEPGMMIPFINSIAKDAHDGDEVIREATEGRGRVSREHVAELREEMRLKVQAEVEQTKEWFAQQNKSYDKGAPGGDMQTIKLLQDAIEDKTHQADLLKEQLDEAKLSMEDLKEWRQVTEEEAQVREAQVEILKNEIANLVKDEKKTDENRARILKLEEQMLFMTEDAANTPSPRTRAKAFATSPGSMRSRSENLDDGHAQQGTEPDVMHKSQNTGTMARALTRDCSVGYSVEELLKKLHVLQNRTRVLETELLHRNEAYEVQCELLEAANDEKSTWQDATQVSNEFNVKLNMRIRDLEEELKEKEKEIVKVKSLKDDLKAKDDQIFVLTEMLGTHERK